MTSQGCYFMQCYRDLFCIKASDATFSSHSHNLPKDIWNEVLQYLRRDELDVVCLSSCRLRKLVTENANRLPLRNLGTVFLNVGKQNDGTRLLVSYRLLDDSENHHINPPGNHRKQWRLFLRCLNNAVVRTLVWDKRIILDRKVSNYWSEELEFVRHLNCHFLLGLTIPLRIECLGEVALFEAMRKRFATAPTSISFSLNSAPHNDPYRPTFPYEGGLKCGYFTEDERLSFVLQFLKRVVFANDHYQPIAKRVFLSHIQTQPWTDHLGPWSSFDLRFLDVVIDAFLSLRECVKLPPEVVVYSLQDDKQRKSQSSFNSWKYAEKYPYDVVDGCRVYHFKNPKTDYLLRVVLNCGFQWAGDSMPTSAVLYSRTISFIVFSPCEHAKQ